MKYYSIGYAVNDGLPEVTREDVQKLTGCELNRLIARETGVDNIPAGLADLDEKAVRFEQVIERETASIESSVEEFLASVNL